MDLTEFKTYQERFERELCSLLSVEAATERVFFGQQQLELTVFGWLLGERSTARTEDLFAVNYYGLYRKSEGFCVLRDLLRRDKPGQVRFIECPVVHFASIKIEQIAEIVPGLVSQFPVFKQKLLMFRNFKKGS